MKSSQLLLRTAVYALIPLAALGIPARLLDMRLGTSPWILLGAILIAMHITLVMLIFLLRRKFALLSMQNEKIKVENDNVK